MKLFFILFFIFYSVDAFKWIEVYFNGLIENCPVLCQVIKEGISSCAVLLAYDHEALQIIVTFTMSPRPFQGCVIFSCH